ncbi:aminotransferase class IV [Marivirga tractuosa]|uniref:branched-chain-amino-acid transaminase n=1 Tax=Marivirga tractuosa (strain ATCC 23168 / DSM 4126 / NBRC 15989 / NCIMB 1408 / VKM B-1430 / H-43) TaxID=643867 RepID=E4TU99_MARTH|nr:aminotransferase class IV [Marivirga tractuosa]ADR21027.1 aminotransferase class IV [Marivirga tractuosa DSM 4126]BDD14518.1 aminotransferase class IV [Marivirga tractuosa]
MINYNGNLTPSGSATLGISNRGFQYGDGIFETIIFRKKEIMFLNEHWERISDSVNDLKLDFPFTKKDLEKTLLELLEVNGLMGQSARVKLYIWRKAGGLYTPEHFDAEFLLTADQAQRKKNQKFDKVGLADTVFLQKTAFSHLKTISALPYVMAGIEKKEKGLEEIILLDQDGYIAEASSSNLYFLDLSNRSIYTPSLQTGCINGVSRRYLFKNAKKFDLEMKEVLWLPEDLMSDRLSIFTINVAGVNCIQKIYATKMGDCTEGLKLFEEIFRW